MFYQKKSYKPIMGKKLLKMSSVTCIHMILLDVQVSKYSHDTMLYAV